LFHCTRECLPPPFFSLFVFGSRVLGQMVLPQEPFGFTFFYCVPFPVLTKNRWTNYVPFFFFSPPHIGVLSLPHVFTSLDQQIKRHPFDPTFPLFFFSNPHYPKENDCSFCLREPLDQNPTATRYLPRCHTLNPTITEFFFSAIPDPRELPHSLFSVQP